MSTPGSVSIDLAALHAGCISLYYSGRPEEGARDAASGVDAARRAGDKTWLRKFLIAQGILESDLHNLPRAFEAFAEAVTLSEQAQDPAGKFFVWNNICCSLLYAELPEQALTAAQFADERACEIADSALRVGARAVAQSNIAFGNLLMCRYGAGLRSAASAARHFDLARADPGPRAENLVDRQLVLMTYRIRLLLRVKVLDEAIHWTQEAKAFVRSSNASPRIATVVEMADALCDVYCGNFNRGAGRLKELLASAKSVAPVLVADGLRDLCEAYTVAHRNDVASVYASRLARHMHSVRAERASYSFHRELASPLAFNGRPAVSATGHSDASVPMSQARKSAAEDVYSVLRDLCIAAELYDDPAGLHPHRVRELARELAARLSVDRIEADRIAEAAGLHDIGKISIPPSILSKRGPLDDAESEILRSHPTIGADLLMSANVSGRQTMIAAVRHHHEWWSGVGYPSRLTGQEIPLAARITALAESFDAMTHDRPYRPRVGIERALSVIQERAGTQFDPTLARIFEVVVRRIQADHGDIDAYLQRGALRSPFTKAASVLSKQTANDR